MFPFPFVRCIHFRLCIGSLSALSQADWFERNVLLPLCTSTKAGERERQSIPTHNTMKMDMCKCQKPKHTHIIWEPLAGNEIRGKWQKFKEKCFFFNATLCYSFCLVFLQKKRFFSVVASNSMDHFVHIGSFPMLKRFSSMLTGISDGLHNFVFKISLRKY